MFCLRYMWGEALVVRIPSYEAGGLKLLKNMW